MRTLCLIIAGVVVGWAASGVDWTRDAVGQEQTSDNQSGDLFRTEDSGDQGAPDHPINAHPKSARSLANDGLDQMGRYVPVADMSGNSSGCFIVDSITGRVWQASGANSGNVRELKLRHSK
jgi:hypothetical protein